MGISCNSCVINKDKQMKTLTLLSALVIFSFSLSAQVPVTKWIGDTLGPWSVISFEESSPFIQLCPSTQSLWQVGQPQKTFFNQAYTIPNAMVTDTVNSYPVNSISCFDLYIGQFNTNYLYNYNLFIDFRHKIDSDTLHDGGFITVSWDYGQTWMNILDDTISLQYYDVTPARSWFPWGNTNLYDSGDTLFTGEKGFSGRSSGWVHSCMAWYRIPVKHPADMLPDTMILRFNFISDNIHNNKEGWMIDQIRIFSIDLGSGVHERSTGMPGVRITPNPVTTSIMVTFDRVYDQVEYQVTDPAGRVQKIGNPGRCSQLEIRKDNLLPGIYFLKITTGAGLSSVSRFVIL